MLVRCETCLAGPLHLERRAADRRFAEPDRATPVSSVLDFDEFMELARTVGAEPVIVVAFGSMYKPAGPGGTAPTKEELIENAVSWVRYADVVNDYGIGHWELGNESYHIGSYNGRAPSVERYIADARARSNRRRSGGSGRRRLRCRCRPH